MQSTNVLEAPTAAASAPGADNGADHGYKGPSHVSTTNACKLCTPLGATLAFKGVEGAIPFLHGSQGCATYMRRYIISHFREPMDIASSALAILYCAPTRGWDWATTGPRLERSHSNFIPKLSTSYRT